MDIQGFKGEHNTCIIKELAIVSTDGQLFEFQLFQPPFKITELSESLQKQVRFLEKHFHGLYWNSGCQPYSKLKDILTHLNLKGTVYVKGCEKETFVSQLLSRFPVKVVNVEELGCPNLGVLKKQLQSVSMKPCVANHNSRNCAYVNVHAVLQWFKFERTTKDRFD